MEVGCTISELGTVLFSSALFQRKEGAPNVSDLGAYLFSVLCFFFHTRFRGKKRLYEKILEKKEEEEEARDLSSFGFRQTSDALAWGRRSIGRMKESHNFWTFRKRFSARFCYPEKSPIYILPTHKITNSMTRTGT